MTATGSEDDHVPLTGRRSRPSQHLVDGTGGERPRHPVGNDGRGVVRRTKNGPVQALP